MLVQAPTHFNVNLSFKYSSCSLFSIMHQLQSFQGLIAHCTLRNQSYKSSIGKKVALATLYATVELTPHNAVQGMYHYCMQYTA